MAHALTGIGRSAPKAADPRRWFPNHPAVGPILMLVAVAATGTAVGYALNRRRQRPASDRRHSARHLFFRGIRRVVRGGSRLLQSSVGRGVIGVAVADLLRRRERLERGSPAEATYGGENI
jgi:hypothetical protein